jgi:polysaccharide export outer membrane protein
MKCTPPLVLGLAVAAAAAICTLAPRPAAAGPHPSALSEPDKKPAPQAPSVPDEYRMSPGDKLRIEVYKDAQLSQSVQVRPDGKVTLPLIGDIEATGRTPTELRDAIATALKEYITKPTVTVIVVEATAATAYVTGEVNHPGVVSLQAPLTILQALALAGGLKDFADAKNIRILRNGSWGVEMIMFNYREALKSARPPIYLRPGDTVVVPD